jgi:hypothetical protein
MKSIDTVIASQEYKDLMQPILAKTIGQNPRKGASQCPKTDLRSRPLSSDRIFLDLLTAASHWLQGLWKPSTKQHMIKIPSLNPTAHLFRDQMLALPSFRNMAPETRSRLSVSVVIPSWLANTEEACHVVSAVQSTFGRLISLETPPSSAYTAAGYELCRISYEAFECTGPGRIMTLEHDGDLTVASIMQTPLLSWATNPVTFLVRTGLNGMNEWINTFIESQRPDMLMIIGANSKDSPFADALAKSRAVPYLVDHASLPPHQVLALGAAQAAKDGLETQPDDCGEPAECEEIRRKANSIAGTYRPLLPSSWPASGSRHVEL